MENDKNLYQQIFNGDYKKNVVKTDKMFVYLFIAQWFLGITLALIFSPMSWDGNVSSIHMHVYFAIFLGGAIAALPIYIIKNFPDSLMNMYVVTVCQMLVSILLIHISGGRIETHFHIFGSLAFIAFYNNFRLIILATVITALDHLIRGMYWPESIYAGSYATLWRTFEHASWVIFEDIFLFISISNGLDSLRLNASSQVAIESALKHTEEKVLERTSELEEAQRLVLEQQQFVVSAAKMSSLGEMAGGLAHEINNPLAIISSTTQFLHKNVEKGKMSNEMLKDCLVDIDTTVDRISKIISGLRNISRDSNEEESSMVVLQEIFNDVLAICSEKFKNNSVEFKIIDKQELLSKEVKCSRVQISQVILNLLMNAYDAISDQNKRWIYVNLQKNKSSLQIIVSDSGKGVPDEIKKKIFQPFFTTKDIGKGTGLGLSISKSIMEKHGGNLSLTDINGVTEFIVELPT